MAYKTEIQIGVKGSEQLKELQARLEKINALTTRLNKQSKNPIINVKSVNNAAQAQNNYNKELERTLTLQTKISKVPGQKTPRPSGGGGRPTASGKGIDMRENLMLGAGFPLLFGGGAGQVGGGLLGSFVGTGFGGQIIGSAFGQQLEDALARVTEIGNALNNLDMSALRESAIYVNSELETTVRRLVEAGDAAKAQEYAAAAVAEQTGLSRQATEDITASVNRLANTWDEVVARASSFLALLSGPIINSLTLILQLGIKISKVTSEIEDSIPTWVRALQPILGPLILADEYIKEFLKDTKDVTESTEERIAKLTAGNDELERELANSKAIYALESRRVNERTLADKEHNAAVDYSIKLEKINQEFAEKTRIARLETVGLTGKEVERKLQLINLTKQQAVKEAERVYALKQQAIAALKRKETLEDEIKIYNIQQKSLEGLVELERSRNDIASARLDLEESRLQRQLDQLNEINGSHIIRGQIIDQIAQKQLRQAQIEYQNNILTIEQSVTKAELARKQVDFEIKRIQLQVESLRLEAQGIKDLDLRKAAMNRILAQEQATLNIAREMIAAADQQLATTRQIAENQKIAAGYALQGKIEAIETSAAEQKRAAFLERAAAAQKQVATSAAAANAASGAAGPGGAGAIGGAGGGSRTTGTVTTSMPIDPEVEERVQSRSGRFGFRSVEEMVGALEDEQRKVNRMEAAMARYSPSTGANGGDASGISPVVNVTTGPVMNMDGQNYVNQNDFVAGLQSASTRGAEMAMQMITSSGGARRRLGVG